MQHAHPTHRWNTPIRAGALAASLLLLCAGCAAPPAAKAPPPAKPVAVAAILKGVKAELATMQKIYDLRLRSGRLLAELNNKLQRRSFSRRVPSQPALPSLASDLHAHAKAMSLDLTDWQVHVRPRKKLAKKGPILHAKDQWTLTPADLEGIIDARMTLHGSLPKIIAFVDGVPKQVERAIWITGQTPVPGGIRFDLQAFYERTPPRPFTELRWPTIEERLEAAGWRLDDPQLAKQPGYGELRDAIKQGRARVPDLRATMDVANDFPRWFARADVLADLTAKIVAVNGADLLSTTPIPADARFPRTH